MRENVDIKWVIIFGDDCIGISSEFPFRRTRSEISNVKKCFTRFPLFAIAFENMLWALDPKRSPKDSADFRLLHRFPVRQEEVLYQRQIHCSSREISYYQLNYPKLTFGLSKLDSILFSRAHSKRRLVVCCLFHVRPATGLKMYFFVFIVFLTQFQNNYGTICLFRLHRVYPFAIRLSSFLRLCWALAKICVLVFFFVKN